MALTINNINAVSHQLFENYIKQHVFDDHPLFDKLQSKMRVKWDGGTKLHVPIRYRKLNQAKTVDPDAGRVTATYDTRTAIELDWAYAVCDIAMTWEERVKNGPDGRIADLMADKAEEGTQDMIQLLSDQFYQDYSAKGTTDFDGFYQFVRNPSTSTTYGGVSSGDAANWIAGLYNTTTSTMSLFGSNSLDSGLRACRFNGYPDMMITTPALASIYASKLQPGERRDPISNKSAGSGGAYFGDLWFRGVPIIEDPQCQDNHWLFITTDCLFFYLHKQFGMEIGKWEEDPDRYNSLRALISVTGNFACTNRRVFGAYTALTS